MPRGRPGKTDPFTEQLKTAIKLQTETICGLNNIISMQQRQYNRMLEKMHRFIGVPMDRDEEGGQGEQT